jgi:hypothetical protein
VDQDRGDLLAQKPQIPCGTPDGHTIGVGGHEVGHGAAAKEPAGLGITIEQEIRSGGIARDSMDPGKHLRQCTSPTHRIGRRLNLGTRDEGGGDAGDAKDRSTIVEVDGPRCGDPMLLEQLTGLVLATSLLTTIVASKHSIAAYYYTKGETLIGTGFNNVSVVRVAARERADGK